VYPVFEKRQIRNDFFAKLTTKNALGKHNTLNLQTQHVETAKSTRCVSPFDCRPFFMPPDNFFRRKGGWNEMIS
jgi:hypothetical protein